MSEYREGDEDQATQAQTVGETMEPYYTGFAVFLTHEGRCVVSTNVDGIFRSALPDDVLRMSLDVARHMGDLRLTATMQELGLQNGTEAAEPGPAPGGTSDDG